MQIVDRLSRFIVAKRWRITAFWLVNAVTVSARDLRVLFPIADVFIFIILAATFGSLALAGINFLTQMGVAIAAFIIAPFLIPSFSAIIGYTIWWPGHRPNKK